MKNYPFFGLLALMLVTLAPSAAAAEDLTTSDIRNRLVGQPIRWWGDGWSAGALCTRWLSARAGQEKCYRLRPQTDRRFLTTGGNVFEVTVPDA